MNFDLNNRATSTAACWIVRTVNISIWPVHIESVHFPLKLNLGRRNAHAFQKMSLKFCKFRSFIIEFL
jgi:hypothetical protein